LLLCGDSPDPLSFLANMSLTGYNFCFRAILLVLALSVEPFANIFSQEEEMSAAVAQDGYHEEVPNHVVVLCLSNGEGVDYREHNISAHFVEKL
jgi:hypothetical protein